MPVTFACCAVASLAIAGVPLFAGFYSKDMILAESFVTPGMAPIGWILLLTAGLTAYYTFRVFFRVFVGPAHYEPGEDGHDAEAAAASEPPPRPMHSAGCGLSGGDPTRLMRRPLGSGRSPGSPGRAPSLEMASAGSEHTVLLRSDGRAVARGGPAFSSMVMVR